MGANDRPFNSDACVFGLRGTHVIWRHFQFLSHLFSVMISLDFKLDILIFFACEEETVSSWIMKAQL